MREEFICAPAAAQNKTVRTVFVAFFKDEFFKNQPDTLEERKRNIDLFAFCVHFFDFKIGIFINYVHKIPYIFRSIVEHSEIFVFFRDCENIPAFDFRMGMDFRGPEDVRFFEKSGYIIRILHFHEFSPEIVQSRDFYGAVAVCALCKIIKPQSQRIGDCLIRINHKNPFITCLRNRKISCGVSPADIFVHYDFTAVLLCDFEGFVRRIHIANHNFIKIFHRFQAISDYCFVIVRMYHNRNRRTHLFILPIPLKILITIILIKKH